MELSQAKEIAISVITETLKVDTKISADMPLIGDTSMLDSMQLVEVCLALEDLAEEYGFEFDWTSDATMSKSRSMFRSVTSLAEEFLNQSESKI